MELPEIEQLVGEAENRVERLRSLYDQYFMGIRAHRAADGAQGRRATHPDPAEDADPQHGAPLSLPERPAPLQHLQRSLAAHLPGDRGRDLQAPPSKGEGAVRPAGAGAPGAEERREARARRHRAAGSAVVRARRRHGRGRGRGLRRRRDARLSAVATASQGPDVSRGRAAHVSTGDAAGPCDATEGTGPGRIARPPHGPRTAAAPQRLEARAPTGPRTRGAAGGLWPSAGPEPCAAPAAWRPAGSPACSGGSRRHERREASAPGRASNQTRTGPCPPRCETDRPRSRTCKIGSARSRFPETCSSGTRRCGPSGSEGGRACWRTRRAHAPDLLEVRRDSPRARRVERCHLDGQHGPEPPRIDGEAPPEAPGQDRRLRRAGQGREDRPEADRPGRSRGGSRWMWPQPGPLP